ncbi:MAG: DUF5667 domain-containing protein, partial [Candidatus Hadarchaeota archaeon]
MLKLTQAGVATVAAVVAAVAIAGGSVATPVAVDSFSEQNPGDPLYGLERAGESIKEATFADGQDWHLERAQERAQEFAAVKERDVSSNHEGLLSESEERLRKGIESTEDLEGLDRAENAVRKHLRILENVENKVPEEAREAVQRAMLRGRTQSKALQEVGENFRGSSGQGDVPPGLLKQELENRSRTVENVVESLKDRELPPGIFKDVVENREVPSDNLMDLLEDRRLSPGVIKGILENREISLDEIESFLEERSLPRGIVEKILEDKGASRDRIDNFLDEIGVPGKPDNVGRPD